MTNGVMISATWGDRKSLSALEKAIASRVKTLQFETTERAVKAVSIKALQSMRAETAIAAKNPEMIDERWQIEIKDSGFTPGWAHPGKHNKKGRRVIRQGGGRGYALIIDPITKNRFVNLAGPYLHACEAAVHCYRLKITERPAQKPFYDSLVLATEPDGIWRFARKRIIRRIGQYRGISRRLLGLAMHKIASNQGESNTGDHIGGLANAYCDVTVSGSGFNSGHFFVSVMDNLPFSALSLKHGYAGVTLALKRASNSVMGALRKTAMRTGFGDAWNTPFPEIAKK